MCDPLALAPWVGAAVGGTLWLPVVEGMVVLAGAEVVALVELGAAACVVCVACVLAWYASHLQFAKQKAQ